MSGLGMGAAMMYSNLCSRADAVNSYSNAISRVECPMYCDKCKAAILAFAAEKPEQESAESEVISTEKL